MTQRLFVNLRYMILLVVIAVLLTGCATDFLKPKTKPAAVVIPARQSQSPQYNDVQVNRYSTISDMPNNSQTNPMLAVSEFKFGPKIRTVSGAINQVLQDTGYSLISNNRLPRAAREVLTKPLPITQRELGPITVGNALRVLMGNEVFTLVDDPVHRLVTFKLKPEYS